MLSPNYWGYWLSFAGQLVSAIALREGKAPKEMAYLHVLSTALAGQTLTDMKLAALMEKYRSEATAQAPVPVEAADVQQIDDEIRHLDELIANA